jgi:hypothetical protein
MKQLSQILNSHDYQVFLRCATSQELESDEVLCYDTATKMDDDPESSSFIFDIVWLN